MLNIKSSKIKEVKDSIDNGIFSKKEWDIFSKFDKEDLKELLFLIENNKIENFYLKIYFTVYSEEVALEVEKDYKNINNILAETWLNTALDIDSKELSEAMLGCVIVNTDFVSRIREGLELNLDYLKKFDKQIESFIKYYYEQIDSNNFYNEFFQPEKKISDKILLSYDNDVSQYVLKTIDKIKVSCLIYELFSILTNSSELDYINSLSADELHNYEKNLKEEIENNADFIRLEDFKFLSDKHLDLLGSIINTSKINNNMVYSLNKKASDVVLSARTEEDPIENKNLECAETKIFSKLSSYFKGSSKKESKKETEIRKPVSFNDFVLTEKPKKFNVAKILVLLFVVVVIISWGAIIQSKHSEPDFKDDVINKKITAAQLPDEKFEIERKGIKDNNE